MYQKYWTMSMKGVSLKGSQTSENDFLPIKASQAIIDSGVSYALLPVKDFEVIKNELAQYNVTCTAPSDDQ
jgi:hypothetical protein